MPGIEVRRAGGSDRAAILRLLAASLHWEVNDEFARFFEWKHEESPFGPSPGWVAVDHDRVVGFRAFLRWQFETRDQAYSAVRAVDTATHPEYQGRGIFRTLTLGALEELRAEGVDFVFNTPNAQSLPGYRSMGWSQVGRLSMAARPRSVRSAIRMLGARVPAGRWPLASEAGDIASAVLGDARTAGLVDRMAPPRGLRTRRTAEFLRWRYGLPQLGYRALAASGGVEEGVAIFRLRARGRATEATLCDVLVPAGAAGVERHLCREVARTSGADYVVRLGASPRFGFVPLARLGPILTWRAVRPGAVEPARRDWDLAMGDVELL